MTFGERLLRQQPILLDGSTGHLLLTRGVELIAPLWSATALLDRQSVSVLRSIHAEYIRAGAELITANTFRTNIRTLRNTDLASRHVELTRSAVGTVRDAIDQTSPDRPVYIAGSVGPAEDCYRPDLVPPDDELYDEHRRQIDVLYTADVDMLLIETINTIREAVSVCSYAVETGLPFAVSFVCKDDRNLVSGEPLEEAVTRVAEYKPAAVMVNCSRPEVMTGQIRVLSKSGMRIGAYANVLATEKKKMMTPEEYVKYVEQWLTEFSVNLVGGCCGTNPQYIGQLAEWMAHR
jgi:S-methylmethionine-dependent homocysteine/selenocysteine methylase